VGTKITKLLIAGIYGMIAELLNRLSPLWVFVDGVFVENVHRVYRYACITQKFIVRFEPPMAFSVIEKISKK
jgi:hypothetical protein